MLRQALAWAAGLALLLVVALLAAFLWYRQASLPLHEGTLRVAGLVAQVEIRRDAHGVPHIVAKGEADALYGLGFAHATDRLWQMDFNRRIAHGRLAELVGPRGVETDRFIRTVGLAQAADRMLAALDAETRALLDAYVAGINAALATRAGPLPPEYLILRAPKPAPWAARDSAAFALLMALDVSQEWRDEIARLRLASRFTLAEINDLRPAPDGDTLPALADFPAQYRLMGLYAEPKEQRTQRDGATRSAEQPSLAGLPLGLGFGPGPGPGLGSNAWAVSGRRSASGKPLLAADPHLALTTPSIWALARIDAPDLQVAGATLPGLPWILAGRNATVAWGITTTTGDGADLYIERLHPTDPAQYQTPDGWAPFDTRSETIAVRGAESVVLTVRSTRHGPVMNGVLGATDAMLDSRRHVLALRWAAAQQAAQDRTLAAIRQMNRAPNLAELQRASQGWTLTQQVFVQADRDGRIGLQFVGRHMLRAPGDDLHGLTPAPGWEARYDWAGLVAPERLPRELDPARGWVAAANHNVVPRGYPHTLGHEYAAPYRGRRIAEELERKPLHDLASMQALQGDQTSLAARAQLALLKDTQPASNAGKLALERLLRWDGRMQADAPEPLLLHAWLRKLRLAVFADDYGPLAAAFVERSEMTQPLINVLVGRAQARDWCDVQGTPRRETCAELAAETLDAAVAELTQQSGRDVLGLRWGEAHVARLEHRPLSSVPVLRRLFEHRLPVGGDTHTPAVTALARDPAEPFTAVHGAGVRLLFDLAAGGGQWILSAGQTGHPFDDHYSDMAALWQQGRTLPIDDKPQKRMTLVLQPAVRR